MRFIVIIPARVGASRLPGKPLREIAGKPLIQHVYERAAASGAARIVIATDDARVQGAAESFGAEVCMTGAQHASGTDRLAEVVRLRAYADDEIIVNLQGDEPQMPAALIVQVAAALAETRDAPMATLCAPIREAARLFDPNVVKVVLDDAGHALYFSRAPIPWDREAFPSLMSTPEAPTEYSQGLPWLRHIGIYAYRAGFLARFTALSPGRLEGIERLEQLRALEHGFHIRVVMAAQEPGIGIDTEADLERAQHLFSA